MVRIYSPGFAPRARYSRCSSPCMAEWFSSLGCGSFCSGSEECFRTLHLLFNMAARRVQIGLTCTAFSSHFILKESFSLSAEASIIEGQMTGVIKASAGIPAKHFGVSTKDFANPSLINLFKHLCILCCVQLTLGSLSLPLPARGGSSGAAAARLSHTIASGSVLLEMQLTLPFRSGTAGQSRAVGRADRSGAGAAAPARPPPLPAPSPAAAAPSPAPPGSSRLQLASLTSCLWRGFGRRSGGSRQRVKLSDQVRRSRSAVRGELRAAAAAGTSGSVQCVCLSVGERQRAGSERAVREGRE